MRAPNSPTRSARGEAAVSTLAAASMTLFVALTACQQPAQPPASGDGTAAQLSIEVTHDASLHDGPLTGRLFVVFAPSNDLEPRIAGYNSARQRNGQVPIFSADVEGAAPGDAMVIDAGADGYPYRRLGGLPAGDYWVQAILHVYTEYERADGHTIWAPQDQWEGQRWAFSPGNYFSEARQVRVDPASDDVIQFELAGELPPIEVPEDTEWVKRIRIQSDILTEWWGHPMYLGAVVLLPRGFDENPDMRYPLLIEESHFTLDPVFGFTTEPPSGGALFSQMREEAGGMRESGYDFAQAWMGEDFPRMVAVILQHPTPYFDDSYGVNSANNGPYGDAIHEELIPYIEENFRLIGEPYSRVMTGGSTGGWMSLAKMLHYPTYYGGTWTYYPDPIDFRRYQLVNIYEDESAFIVPNSVPGAPERMFQRSVEGQPVGSNRQISQLEVAQGSRGRGAGQLDAWHAVYGPTDEDGYPRRLWDLDTGIIDREVAYYMRDNGYDLRHYAEENWPEIGPDLVGKIKIYNPEMDHFYLPYAVYMMEDFLESTTDPYYAGEFIHGAPMKGHGWSPFTNADLVRQMAAHVADNAPEGASKAWMEGR